MTTNNILPTTPSDQAEPLIPHSLELELSDDQIRKFQRLMRKESRVELSFEEARQRGLELLRLTLMLMDPAGYERRMKEPPVWNLGPVEPLPLLAPQTIALPLDGDHAQELDLSLQKLAHELELVARRPSSWRWALVALWEALAHALAAHRPGDFRPRGGLGELSRLFLAVSGMYPELPQVGTAIEEIDRLRTRFITAAVTRWPVSRKRLPGIFIDCLRVVHRLEPSAASPLGIVEGRLQALQ